ncbi:uracil-DNA glycosylase [Helicobacter burdigaliensis]|uniref:uracil-DNA glycosylase n=1 Tax=Helicobacter burdigaliensis TaxID=2315334 RepID=UPI000EF6674A|nr:uracil-DNA glycosylase [Helicobacter burdigaliensis]
MEIEISLENIKIHSSWKEVLKEEFLSPYFLEIKRQYLLAKQNGAILYPPAPLLFNAFNLTPFDKVKVVLLGQDPYHNEHQAMGLSFSVPQGVPPPPSLKNIYKELWQDLQIPISQSGDLSSWAKEGVLLLNSILSVEKNKPGSHKDFGWQTFSDSVIKHISQKRENIVFLLWGNYARSKKTLIDANKHLILEATHPSPLAGNKFLGCKHFSKTNAYLISKNISPITWNIP